MDRPGSSPAALLVQTVAATAAVLVLIVAVQMILGAAWEVVLAGWMAKLWMAFVVGTVVVVALELRRRRRGVTPVDPTSRR